MPLYRDKITVKVVNFDHEPTDAELDAKFGNGPATPPEGQVPVPQTFARVWALTTPVPNPPKP